MRRPSRCYFDSCIFDGSERVSISSSIETPEVLIEAAPDVVAELEQNVLQGPFGSTYRAPQPPGHVIVHDEWPGAVQVKA